MIMFQGDSYAGRPNPLHLSYQKKKNKLQLITRIVFRIPITDALMSSAWKTFIAENSLSPV